MGQTGNSALLKVVERCGVIEMVVELKLGNEHKEESGEGERKEGKREEKFDFVCDWFCAN